MRVALSNALFFNLGARIYRFTGSDQVADYVTMAYSWLESRELIDRKTGAVYDGAHVDDNCTDINKIQWSYNAASLSMGLAYLYNTVSSITFMLKFSVLTCVTRPLVWRTRRGGSLLRKWSRLLWTLSSPRMVNSRRSHAKRTLAPVISLPTRLSLTDGSL